MDKTVDDTSVAVSPRSLVELALVFLRLGTTAFGGPAAHIAMMRQEFVARRGWLTETEFLDLVGASNLIPGPGSTEVAIYIGVRRAGWMGLLLAGVCFIFPAACLWSLSRWSSLPPRCCFDFGLTPSGLCWAEP